MAQKIKKSGYYILILALVGMQIGFNYWTSMVRADTISTAVQIENVAPVVSAVSLGTIPRGTNSQINLTENEDTEIRASATVTDNTCGEISGTKAYVFVSSSSWEYNLGGTTCSFDYNDCYTPEFAGGNLNCVQQSCVEGVPATAIYDCTASTTDQGGLGGMWYHASPTDSVASYNAQYWYAMVIATDSFGGDSYATSAVAGVDVILLGAIGVGANSNSIDYGPLSPGGESAAVLERGVENTGNRGTNITIEATTGLEISGGGANIASEQQEYNLSSFNVAEGEGTSLSGDPAELDVVLFKPQTHASGDNDDQIFWGIAVPAATLAGSYTGVTTYSPISD